MSSPLRCPKELKSIIDENNSLNEEVLARNFEKLHMLSKDDQNEIAMLRSRIDEQSQLICILKKRADEFIIKNQCIESINRDLRDLNETIEEKFQEEQKRADLLDQRFSELAENHEEMIKYKDQHKLRNKELLIENEKLRKDNENLFSAAIQERDMVIGDQRKVITKMEQDAKAQDASYKSLQNDMNNMKKELNKQISKLTNELKNTKELLSKSESERKDAIRLKKEAESFQVKGFERLQQEKEELVTQVMNRGKLLQERQTQIEKLEEDVARKNSEVEQAKSKFMIMEAKVDANARVKMLQMELEEANQSIYRMKMEFEAFRVHSNNLLSQEKDLNKKLRHNIMIG